MNVPDQTICSPLQVKHRYKLANPRLFIRVGEVELFLRSPTHGVITRRTELYHRPNPINALTTIPTMAATKIARTCHSRRSASSQPEVVTYVSLYPALWKSGPEQLWSS
jgi:hypothetical protein